ncbi:MAG: hypothetical protein V3S54_09265 [Woeseiaceae bacterium]
MAKFTPGPVAARISGSIGGTVFSRNRGGSYMRLRTIPTDPNTTAQQNVRAILASQSQAWAALTIAQRAAWENFADQNPITDVLGESVLLSGHQSFVKLNSRLDFDDQATLLVPPIVVAPTALDTIVQTGDIGAGTVAVAFTATPLAAGVKLWQLAAVLDSPGITYVRNRLRFVGTSAAAQASPFDNQTQIEAKFGTLVVNQTLHVRVLTFDTATGLVSVALEDSVVIITT